MEIIGRILKENRIRKNLTVHEIAVVTKINSRIIKAIEEGNLDELPSKSFLRGFIRSYASYLKLDVDEILKTFQEELGSTIYQPSQKKKLKTLKKSKNKNTSKTKPQSFFYERSFLSYIFWGSLLFCTVFVFIGIKNLVKKYRDERRISLSPQILNHVQPLKVRETQRKEILPKEDSSTDTVSSVQLNIKNEKTKTPIREEKINKEKTQNQKKETSFLTQKNENQWNELILEAFKNVKVKLKNMKNNKVKELSLLKGDVQIIKFKHPIQLQSNQPKHINVIYKGKNRGLLSKKKIIFKSNVENPPSPSPL